MSCTIAYLLPNPTVESANGDLNQLCNLLAPEWALSVLLKNS
jgi:hypothetical protein